MSEVAIRVENLGKKYHLGGKKSGSFRESVNNLFKKSKPKATEAEHEFWALKDINFEIKRGEAVGIIGRNGAGKSTLLKILSRITEPTKGRFEVFGRVSSLLEVGTGFHPELTGRENVYLNGTILGMKRHEVKAKFDEIVAFSGVEKFIDTPVKHYSSGMQVRLAFAVAAHLEPEILIIDEVLAVGDAEFQKKCLGKMEDVTGEGRTVLFVSHNMGAVQSLCSRVITIQNGIKANDGKPEMIVKEYLQFGNNFYNNQILNRKGSQVLIVESISVYDSNKFERNKFRSDEPLIIELNYRILDPSWNYNNVIVGIGVKDELGNNLLLHHNRLVGILFQNDEVVSRSKFLLKLDNLPLNKGVYSLHYSIMQSVDYIDHAENVLQLEISDEFPYNYRELPSIGASKVLTYGKWSIV